MKHSSRSPAWIQSLVVTLYPLLIVLALFAALNYQGHNYSYRWLVASEFLLGVLMFFQLVGHYRQSLVIPANTTTICYVLFMLWCGLSLLWSAAPSDSFMTLLAIAPCLLALLIAAQLQPRQWLAIQWGLLPVFLAVAGYSVYQSFWLNLERPAGFLLDWNSNAVFMAMLVAPFAGMFFKTQNTSKRAAVWLLMAAAGFVMALTQSRGALLALAVAGVALIPYLRKSGLWRDAGWLALALAVGFLIGDWLNGGLLFARFSKPLANPGAVTAENLASGRMALWAAGWQMFLDRPGLGWGLGTYHWLYPQYRNPLQVEGGQLAHNDYLETLLSVGPLGLLLLLGFVLSAFNLQRRLLVCQGAGAETAQVTTAISLGILAHSAVNFNLYQPCILILLGLFLGYGWRIVDHDAPRVVPARAMTPEGYYGIVGGSGLMLAIGCITLFTAMHYKELASDHAKLPTERMNYLQTASRYLPFMEEYYALQAAVAMDLLKAKTEPGSIDENLYQELVGQTLQVVDQGINRNPLRALSYRNRAELLAVKAQSDASITEVMAQYMESLKLDPYDLETRISYCGFLMQHQKTQLARNVMAEGLGKAYYAEAKHGMQLLLSLHQLSPSEDDKRQINTMINQLGPKLLNEAAQVFTLGTMNQPLGASAPAAPGVS